jgi:hypothetical protein
VVGEAEWGAAVEGLRQRRGKAGRVGSVVNIFSSLLRNARDGDTFFVSAWAQSKGGQRVLINTAGSEARAKYESFPADVFEAAILSLLREVDPHEILNGDEEPDETGDLSKQLEGVEASLDALQADMDKYGESPGLLARFRRKEDRKAELVKLLKEARQKAAYPLSESWGTAHGLIDALAAAPDPTDTRLRLRSALRRIVESIYLLIVPRGRDRLLACQMFFADKERHREYLICHRSARGNARARSEARTRVGSLADVMKRGDLNMRREDDVLACEERLLAEDIDKLLARR